MNDLFLFVQKHPQTLSGVKMKKMYLVTYGRRYFGVNPVHTVIGLEQIRNLELPPKIDLIISGTGNMFIEIMEIISHKFPGASVVYSPFCGSADGLEFDGKGILANGRKVDLDTEYIGLTDQFFNAWTFIDRFPSNTLFCAGGELMIALGLKNINTKGALYQLTVAYGPMGVPLGTGKKVS